MTAASAYLPPPGATGARAVLRSLPLSFVETDAAQDAVVAVDGGRGWPAEAAHAIRAGASGVIVIHPRPAGTAELSALVQQSHAQVILDHRWASNPAVREAASACVGALSRADRLECHTILPVGSDLTAALLDQLALIRALLGPVSGVQLLTRNESGYAAEGETLGHPVDLLVTCTDAVAPNAHVRLLTVDGGVTLRVPDGRTAQPAELVVVTPDGALQAPTRYETGHRASWRRARTVLTASQSGSATSPPVVADLNHFISDQDTAQVAFSHDEG